MKTSSRTLLTASLCLGLLLSACGRRLRTNNDQPTEAPAVTIATQAPAPTQPPAAQPTQAPAASQPTATLVVQPTGAPADTQAAAPTNPPVATQAPAATTAAEQPDPQADQLDKLLGQLDSQLKNDGQSIDQVAIP